MAGARSAGDVALACCCCHGRYVCVYRGGYGWLTILVDGDSRRCREAAAGVVEDVKFGSLFAWVAHAELQQGLDGETSVLRLSAPCFTTVDG